jgi:hypothetical protein
VPDALLDALTERDRRVYWDRVLARRNGETFGYDASPYDVRHRRAVTLAGFATFA